MKKYILFGIAALSLLLRLFFLPAKFEVSLEAYKQIYGSIYPSLAPWPILLHFASFISDYFAFLILPNIWIFFSVFLIGLICLELTKNDYASWIAAFFVGLMPYYAEKTLFSASELSIAIPLFILCIYSFIRLNKLLIVYLLGITLLILTSKIAIVLIFGLFIYAIFSRIEKSKYSKQQGEIVIFSILFFIWVYFLTYKEQLVSFGFSYIDGSYMNLPFEFDAIKLAMGIGPLVLIMGLHSIYFFAFRLKRKKLLLPISLIVSTFILAIIGTINFSYAILCAGILFCIMMALSYVLILNYLEKTKFAYLGNIFMIVLILSALLNFYFNFYPLKNFKFEDFGDYSNIRGTVLAPAELGYMLKSKGIEVLLDSDYFERIDGIENKNVLEKLQNPNIAPTEAITLLNKKGISYLFFRSNSSVYSQSSYTNSNCFIKSIYGKFTIARVACTVTT